MNDIYNPIRPPWDTSQSGPLPENLAEDFAASAKIAAKQEAMVEELENLSPEQRIARLDAMQEEATSLANSRGVDLMTPEQQFINTWTREAASAAGQLNVFGNPNSRVDDRAAKITDNTYRLATALYKLGKIDEALMIATPFPDLVLHIEEVRAAIDYPDDALHAHACPRPQAEQDGKVIEIDRRWNTEDVMSAKHGKLVHIWECVVCGVANASPDTPIRQQQNQAVHSEVRQLLKEGKPIPKRLEATSTLKAVSSVRE